MTSFTRAFGSSFWLLAVAPALAQPAPAAPQPPVAPPPAGQAAAPAGPRLSAGDAGVALPPKSLDRVSQALRPVASGLTARGLADKSEHNSHGVRQRLAEIEAARARVDQTTAQFLPRLTLRASYTRVSPTDAELGGAIVGAATPGRLQTAPCADGGGNCVVDAAGQPVGAAEFVIESYENNYALTAQLTVPISDYVLRLSNAAAGASANLRASELTAKAERLRVRADAEVVFWEWVRARARVAIAEQSLESTRARLNDARPAYELGNITRADLLRLEALVASTEQIVVETRSYAELAEIQIALLTGQPREKLSFVLGEDITRLPRPLPGTLETLTREALTSRYEAQSMQEAERALRHAGSATRAGVWPRIDAFGDFTYANPNQRYFPPEQAWHSSWSLGASATWTVGDAIASAASARELEANGRALAAQRAALHDGIRQEVAASSLLQQRATGALGSAERGLAAAQEAYRVATDLYRFGRSTTTEVIEAETDLLRARLNELDARVGVHIAHVRLSHAVGRDRLAAR